VAVTWDGDGEGDTRSTKKAFDGELPHTLARLVEAATPGQVIAGWVHVVPS
jgi:hypothetical protein